MFICCWAYFSYTKILISVHPDQIFTFPNSSPKPLDDNQLLKIIFPNYYKHFPNTEKQGNMRDKYVQSGRFEFQTARILMQDAPRL